MKSIYLQLESAWYAIFIVTLIVCSGCRRESVTGSVISKNNHALIPISTGIITNGNEGGGDFIGYDFYLISNSSHYDEINSLLIFKNISSKSIDLSGIIAENFSLKDSHGKVVTLVLRSVPRVIANEGMTSLQIAAIHSTNLSYPLTLTFKTTLADIPVYLCITNIGTAKL
jgi:hypothetical protein